MAYSFPVPSKEPSASRLFQVALAENCMSKCPINEGSAPSCVANMMGLESTQKAAFDLGDFAARIGMLTPRKISLTSAPINQLQQFMASNLFKGFGTMVTLQSPSGEQHSIAVTYNSCGLLALDPKSNTMMTLVEYLGRFQGATSFVLIFYDQLIPREEHVLESRRILASAKTYAGRSRSARLRRRKTGRRALAHGRRATRGRGQATSK
jgi:hypothetical protein